MLWIVKCRCQTNNLLQLGTLMFCESSAVKSNQFQYFVTSASNSQKVTWVKKYKVLHLKSKSNFFSEHNSYWAVQNSKILYCKVFQCNFAQSQLTWTE